jgi:hypothetical protein
MVAPSGHEAERWRSRQERGINPCPVPGRAPQLRQRSRRSRRAGPRREPRTVSEASRRLRADWWGDASVGGRVCERLSIAHIKVAADDPTTLADHPRCHTRLVALRRFGVCLVASGLSAERLRGPPRADRPKREVQEGDARGVSESWAPRRPPPEFPAARTATPRKLCSGLHRRGARSICRGTSGGPAPRSEPRGE